MPLIRTTSAVAFSDRPKRPVCTTQRPVTDAAAAGERSAGLATGGGAGSAACEGGGGRETPGAGAVGADGGAGCCTRAAPVPGPCGEAGAPGRESSAAACGGCGLTALPDPAAPLAPPCRGLPMAGAVGGAEAVGPAVAPATLSPATAPLVGNGVSRDGMSSTTSGRCRVGSGSSTKGKPAITIDTITTAPSRRRRARRL